MRQSLFALPLLVCPAFAAPIPLPSRAADRATFEAASADLARAAVARVASPAFLERVAHAAVPLGAKLPDGVARRGWLAARLRGELTADGRVRVKVVGCEREQARAVRDAVVQVLTNPVSPADRALLAGLQGDDPLVEQVKVRRMMLRGVVIGGGGGRALRIWDESADAEQVKLFESIQAESMATPLRRLP